MPGGSLRNGTSDRNLMQTLAFGFGLSFEPADSTFALPKFDKIAADNFFGLFDCGVVIPATEAAPGSLESSVGV
jgi:hypothetical protein